jgi:hypothetical protein
MNYTNVKTEAEASLLAGTAVTLIKENGNIKEIQIGDLVIKQAESYSSNLGLLREEPETADRYRVRAVVAGIEIVEFYEGFGKAEDRRAQLSAAVSGETEVTSERVTCTLDDVGNVLGVVGEEDGCPCSF